MHEEFVTLLKKLNVPLLTEQDAAKLRLLQKEWKHWEAREEQHMPLRIAEEQRAAYVTFLDNPNAENEQRLMVLADTNLTGTRYGLLRRAFAELRGRLCSQAADIVRPVIHHALAVLNAEHERRQETAEPVMGSKNRNPAVIETRRAIEYGDRISQNVLDASTGRRPKPPLDLADELIASELH
jgi:hypothetical protein